LVAESTRDFGIIGRNFFSSTTIKYRMFGAKKSEFFVFAFLSEELVRHFN